MPRSEYCPRFMLTTGVDLEAQRGITIAFLDGDDLLVEGVGATDYIEFEDQVEWLNGHGSASTPSQILDTAFAVSNKCFVDIDENDKVRFTLYASVPSSGFTVMPIGDSWRLGFPPDLDTASVYVPADAYGPDRFVATAPMDWIRGDFDSTEVRVYYFVGLYKSIPAMGHVQDVPTWLRATNAVNSLQGQSDALVANTRWGMTDEGHAFFSLPAGAHAITWDSTSLRDRLGFTGAEVGVVSASGYVVTTAANPCPGVIAPSRPLSDITMSVEDVSFVAEQTDSGLSSNNIGSYVNWSIQFYVDGPADDWEDLHQHFARRFLPYAGLGQRVTLYQDVGDSRLSVEAGNDYSVDQTPEMNHYRGRVRCRVHKSNAAEFVLKWNRPELRRMAPVTFKLRETIK